MFMSPKSTTINPKLYLSQTDFPGIHEIDATKVVKVRSSSRTLTLERGEGPEELIKQMGDVPEGEIRILRIPQVGRNAFLNKSPAQYALTIEEVQELRESLKTRSFDLLHEYRQLSLQRIETGWDRSNEMFRPERPDQDLVLRGLLGYELSRQFRLEEIDPEHKEVSILLPMLQSRYSAFTYLHGTCNFDKLKLVSTADVRNALIAFKYIIRHFAVGEMIYRLYALDGRLAKLSKDLAAQQNPVQTKLFLSLITGPFLCTLLSTEDHELAEVMNKGVDALERLMPLLGETDINTLTLLNQSILRVWDIENSLSFGTLLNFFFDCDQRELRNGTTESISRYLLDSYGEKGERVIGRLKKTTLHTCCMAIADAAHKCLGIDFLHGYFEEIGFITPDVLVDFDSSSLIQFNKATVSKKRMPTIQSELEGIDFSGKFFEVLNRHEASDNWAKICNVVKRIVDERFSGELQRKLLTSFRKSVSNLQYDEFIKSMVARGVLYLKCRETRKGIPIDKWAIAEKLAFFRDVSQVDLDEWRDGKNKETEPLRLAKRNFDQFLRKQCHLASVDASDLIANGNYSVKECDFYDTL